VDILFEKVAVKPGRPTVFGKKQNRFVFGLPGNPVSSFIIFELIAKPFIYRLMGHDYKPVQLQVPVGVDYSRKKADRIAWTPVKLENGTAIPFGLSWFGTYPFTLFFTWIDGNECGCF
jgi:molybdopterin molybdotransferase